jgi:hypothetical protein
MKKPRWSAFTVSVLEKSNPVPVSSRLMLNSVVLNLAPISKNELPSFESAAAVNPSSRVMDLVTDADTLKSFVAAVVDPQLSVTVETRLFAPRLFLLTWTSTNSQLSSFAESSAQSLDTSEGVAAPAWFISGTATAAATTGASMRAMRFFLLR